MEQYEIDRPTSFDRLGERGLDAGRLVQIQQREYHCFVLSRELSGRFLNPGQAAPVTRAIECSIGVSVMKRGGQIVRPREARIGLLI